MDITPLGLSSFKIRGKHATVVIENDVLTVSREGSPYSIKGPGEYEVGGVGIVGHAIDKNTVYRVEIDGLAIVHLSGLDRALTTAEVDELDGVDILMVPINGAQAVAVINEIEPSVVIPMQYEKPQLDAFLKEIGKEAAAQAKLTVTRDKLPEAMQVVVLE